MTEKNSDDELLIEAVTTAWRPKSRDQIGHHPNWFDLTEHGREQAFKATQIVRKIEAAFDNEGLSATSRAVLARIEEAR